MQAFGIADVQQKYPALHGQPFPSTEAAGQPAHNADTAANSSTGESNRDMVSTPPIVDSTRLSHGTDQIAILDEAFCAERTAPGRPLPALPV
jgi:hypothetical protein